MKKRVTKLKMTEFSEAFSDERDPTTEVYNRTVTKIKSTKCEFLEK